MKDAKEAAVNSQSEQKTPAVRSNGARLTNLIIGDALVFLIFALIGRRSHGEAAGFNTVVQIVVTALPFLAGWFIVSPFLGAFRKGLETRPLEMAKKTLLAWICAWPVAMILRGIFVDHAIPPWTFWLVALLANTILLLLWRVPVAFLGRIRERGSH
jgi:Protein of unknown function (DUF3054)